MLRLWSNHSVSRTTCQLRWLVPYTLRAPVAGSSNVRATGQQREVANAPFGAYKFAEAGLGRPAALEKAS
jgi:hypothetical protein